MGYYSALKGKEITIHCTTWMCLEDVMLNERSQSQKDKCCAVSLEGSGVGNLQKQHVEQKLPRAEGGSEEFLMGPAIVLQDENVLEVSAQQ